MGLIDLDMVNASVIYSWEESISHKLLKLSHIWCDELVSLVTNNTFEGGQPPPFDRKFIVKG
jgi:hypothetical protein